MHKSFSLVTYNFPCIDWQNVGPLTAGNSESRNFVDVCLNFNLNQIILELTRVAHGTSNILDLILKNYPENLSPLIYMCEISDHKVIHAAFKFPSKPRKTFKKTVRMYNKGNYDALNNELQALLPSFHSSFHH